MKIEYAKELDNATILMLGSKYLDGDMEKVLRIYKIEDLDINIPVNQVGNDIEVNKKIFESHKHICELIFYHNESIDALIHRLEEIKKM